MRLKRALRVERGEIVSLVGAGGKTTTMFRLADELVTDGWKVLTTTTTMIWREERCAPTVLEPDGDRLLDEVRRELAEHSRVTVASGFDEAQGKLVGIDPSLVDALITLPEVDAVIVEADGAKGRSLKAPAPYEPVIPSSTSLLVPMAAIDAVGRPLPIMVERVEMIKLPPEGLKTALQIFFRFMLFEGDKTRKHHQTLDSVVQGRIQSDNNQQNEQDLRSE